MGGDEIGNSVSPCRSVGGVLGVLPEAVDVHKVEVWDGAVELGGESRRVGHSPREPGGEETQVARRERRVDLIPLDSPLTLQHPPGSERGISGKNAYVDGKLPELDCRSAHEGGRTAGPSPSADEHLEDPHGAV